MPIRSAPKQGGPILDSEVDWPALTPEPPLGRRTAAYDLFAIALANVPHGLCMFDRDKRLILCNPAYGAMYGLSRDLMRPGTSLHAILAHRGLAGNAPVSLRTYFDVVPIAKNSGSHAGTRVKLVDGRTVQITHNPMADGGYVAVHEDVTAHVDAEDRLRHLAAHDQLTGLCNRRAFAEAFEAALAAQGRRAAVAVHCLDLDRFKAVNDALGHHAGDTLLRLVAERILSCTETGDVVGRLGGDEFIVLQHAVEHRNRAEHFGRSIVDAITRPFDLDGHSVSIGISGGTAIHPLHGRTSDVLLKSADRALYGAKSGGGNAVWIAEHPDVGSATSPRAMRRGLRPSLLVAPDASGGPHARTLGP